MVASSTRVVRRAQHDVENPGADMPDRQQALPAVRRAHQCRELIANEAV